MLLPLFCGDWKQRHDYLSYFSPYVTQSGALYIESASFGPIPINFCYVYVLWLHSIGSCKIALLPWLESMPSVWLECHTNSRILRKDIPIFAKVASWGYRSFIALAACMAYVLLYISSLHYSHTVQPLASLFTSFIYIIYTLKYNTNSTKNNGRTRTQDQGQIRFSISLAPQLQTFHQVWCYQKSQVISFIFCLSPLQQQSFFLLILTPPAW